MEKYTANTNQKTAEVAVLIPEKIDFETKIVSTPHKKRTIYNDKRDNSSKDLTIINICAPNIRAPKIHGKKSLLY